MSGARDSSLVIVIKKTMSVLFLTRNDRKALVGRFHRWLLDNNLECEIHVTHESAKSPIQWCSDEECIVFHQIPKLNAHHYPSWISDLLEQNGITCVVPLGDRDLLPLIAKIDASHLSTRLATDCRFSVVSEVLDKATYFGLGGRNWSAPSFMVASNGTYDDWCKKLGPVPWIMKPRNGTSSKGVEIIRNRRQYDSAERRPDNVIQRYVEGIHITVDVLKVGGQFQLAARYREHVVGSQTVVMSPCADKEILTVLSEIAQSIDLFGVWNFQVICDRGYCYLHDINPRPSSGLYHSIARGLEVFQYIYDLAFPEEIPTTFFNNKIRDDLEMCIYQEYELREVTKL